MRIFLTVLLVLLVLLLAVCLSNAVISLRYWDNAFTWSIRYLGIRILPRKKKPEKKSAAPETDAAADTAPEAETMPEAPETDAPQETAAETPPEETPPQTDAPAETPTEDDKAAETEPAQEEQRPANKDFAMDKLRKLIQGLSEKADLAGSALAALPPPLKRLLWSVKLSRIETDIIVGGEDAADCARLYGMIYALLEPLIGNAAHTFRAGQRKLFVRCDYTRDTSQWNADVCVKVNVGIVLSAGIWLAARFLKDRCRARKTTAQSPRI